MISTMPSMRASHRVIDPRVLVLLPVLAAAAVRPAASGDPPAVAAGARSPAHELQRLVLDTAASVIGFDASASFGPFRGRAERVSGWAEVPDTFTFQATRGHVEIEAASLRTGNGMRDRHLRGEMDTERFPLIIFEVDSVTAAGLAEIDSILAPMATLADTLPAARVYIRGRLTVRAVEVAVRVPAWVRTGEGSLHVRGRLRIRFTELGMEPPSRFLGMISVSDDLVLRFDARFRPVPR